MFDSILPQRWKKTTKTNNYIISIHQSCKQTNKQTTKIIIHIHFVILFFSFFLQSRINESFPTFYFRSVHITLHFSSLCLFRFVYEVSYLYYFVEWIRCVCQKKKKLWYKLCAVCRCKCCALLQYGRFRTKIKTNRMVALLGGLCVNWKLFETHYYWLNTTYNQCNDTNNNAFYVQNMYVCRTVAQIKMDG